MTEREMLEFMSSQFGIDTGNLDSSTPLFSSGILDSFSLVSLVTFLEQHCGITVEPLDVTLENLDSVQRILTFVAAKQR